MFALSPDAPPALPFWIDGRAVLSLGECLVDVQNPRQEPVLRRVPVCDAAVAQRAVAAACAAQPAWAALDPALRQGVLAALATALAGYVPHFARLLGEDAGLTATAAAEDVARAEQALLALPAQAPLSPVCALLPAADDPAPFSDAVRRLAMALNAGSAVLLLSSPCVAAPLLALAELAARSGVPAGVFNLVHGDAMSARALQAAIGDSAG